MFAYIIDGDMLHSMTQSKLIDLNCMIYRNFYGQFFFFMELQKKLKALCIENEVLNTSSEICI